MNDSKRHRKLKIPSVVGEPMRHESAHLHVAGSALYTDDIPLPADTLHAAFGVSPIAHGRVKKLELSEVEAAPGVVAIAACADVPGENNYGSILHDDPVFADGLVQYAGQPLFAVAATSRSAARKAVTRAQMEFEELPAILDVRSAVAAGSFLMPDKRIVRGDPEAALQCAPHRLSGSLAIGGQDHFYLEGQIAIAIPQEDRTFLVHCSTQHPTEVQNVVAHALGLHAHAVTVQCRRMGGGFGGKESQPALLAAAAAVLARKARRPVKLRLDRDADMLVTGKRHHFVADYDAGFDEQGKLLGLKVMLAAGCGYSADL